MDKINVAPFYDKDSDMGPLISKDHMHKVQNLLTLGKKKEQELEMEEISKQGYENGYFVGPILFDNVLPEMEIYKNEIFGPVLSVLRVNSYEEAMTSQ